MAVMAHDGAITQACSQGHLELNPFLPLVADALLDSLDLLGRACGILRKHCVEGLAADEERCRRQVANATASLTALVERLGYRAASEAAAVARAEGRGIREVVVGRKLLTAEEYDRLTAPENVMRLGHAQKGRAAHGEDDGPRREEGR